LLKNPLNSFSETATLEVKLLIEFLEYIGWVREHITRKIQINELIESFNNEISSGVKILSKALGKIL
jgi:hypothetical protein